MMHDDHQSLLGYHPDQILHDGCAECEDRGRHPEEAIARLDRQNFQRAWRRAATLQLHGLPHNVAACELPLLRVLAAIEVQLERRGLRIGELP